MDAFVGEIRMFGGDFVIANWARCEGQEVPISGAPDLFRVLGNTYGGTPGKTFKLPDLRNLLPAGAVAADIKDDKYSLGHIDGKNDTYTITTVPAHTHIFNGTATNPKQKEAGSAFNATFPDQRLDSTLRYAKKTGSTDVTGKLDVSTVVPAGASLPTPISNMQASVVYGFLICCIGTMPF